MADTLKSRLARARELARSVRGIYGETVPPGEKPAPDVDAPSEHLPGWVRTAPFVLSRTLRRPNPLPEVLDLRPYLPGTPGFENPGTRGSRVQDGSDLRRFPASRLLYLDLETTGLSGGAGTVAFLAGFGRVVPGDPADGFQIRQFLLTDYPGEGDFLDLVSGELGCDTVLASYNGRSFDEPLLRTRFVLNRKEWLRRPHADFLPAVRRLWRKRFPDCTLGTVEALLLGKRRTLDVPGARIPEIWFEYSKKGFHPQMEAVLEHNAVDLESLAAVAAECARAHEDPVEARDCDRTALGALWLRLEPAKGRAALERAFAEGDERAGWMLLKGYRRDECLDEYRRILGALSPSWRSWTEKAKDAEHRLRDPRAGLEAALAAGEFAGDAELQEALELRIRRLKRKLAAIRPRGDRTDLPR